MSELLNRFRERFPEDTRSDVELIGEIGNRFEGRGADLNEIDSDFAKEFDEWKKSTYPSLGEEAKRGLKRGVAQSASTVWAGVASAADAADLAIDKMVGDRDAGLVGLDSMEKARDRAMESYDNERRVADRNAPSIRSYRDVDDFSDGLRFITGLGGEVAPSAAMAIASGGVGGIAASTAGKQVAKRALAKKISGKLGEEALERGAVKGVRNQLVRRATAKAARRGTATGVAASSVLQNAGETYGELYDTAASRGDRIGAALTAGSIAGALDAAVPIAVLRRVFPAKAVKGMGDEALKKTAIRQVEDKIDKAFEGYSSLKRKFFTVMAKDTSNEAWTESAQEAIQEAAQAYADPDYQFDADAFRERLINASIAGAVGGAQFGGVSAVSETYRQAGTNRNLREIGEKWNDFLEEEDIKDRASKPGYDEEGNFDLGRYLAEINNEPLLRPIYEGEGVEFNTGGDIDPSEGMPLFNEDGSFNFARTQGPGIPESLSKELTDLVNFAQRESARTGTGPVRALLTYIDPQNEFHSVEIRGESLEAIERQAKERGARKVQVSQIGADPQRGGSEQQGGDQDQAPLEDITAEERETAEAMLELADFDFSDAELREQAVSNLVREQRERRGAAANEQEEESLETTEAVRAAEQEEIQAIEGLDLDAELKAELTAQVREAANERIEELDEAAGVREWTLTDAEGDSITVRADSEMEAFAVAAQQNFEPVEATSKKARKRIEDLKRVPVPQKRIGDMTDEELFSKGMQDWERFGNAKSRLRSGDTIYGIAGKRGQDLYNAGWQKARDEGRANRDNPTVTDRAREAGVTEEQFREQNPQLSAEVDRASEQSKTYQFGDKQFNRVEVPTFDGKPLLDDQSNALRVEEMTEEQLFSYGMDAFDELGDPRRLEKITNNLRRNVDDRTADLYEAGWKSRMQERLEEKKSSKKQSREPEQQSEQAQQPEAAQQRESVETTTTDPFVASEGFSFYDTDSITQIYGDTEAGIAKESGYGRAKFNESGEQASSKKTTRRALAIRDRSTGSVTVRGVYNNGNGVFVHKPSGQGENITKALGANQEVIGIVEFDAGGAPLTESETSKLEKLAEKPREDYTNADRNLLKGLAQKKYGFTNIYHEMPEAEFLSITEGRVSDPRESFEQKLERGSIQSVRPGEGIENMITFSDDGEIQTVEDEGDGSVEIGGDSLSEAEVSETFDTAGLVTDDIDYSGDEDARELVLETLRDEIGMPSPEVETLLSRMETGTTIEIEELLENEELLPAFTASVEASGLRKGALNAHYQRAGILIQQLYEFDQTRKTSRDQSGDEATPREADSTVSGVSGTGRQSGRAQGQAPTTPGRGRRERPDDAAATTAGNSAPELSQRASGRSDGSEAGDRSGTESGEPASRRLDWQPLEDGYVAYAGAISLGVRGSGREWEVRILIDDEPAFAETFIGEPDAAMLYAEQQATQQILEAEETVDGAEELVDETVDAEGGPLTTEQLTRAIEEEGQDGRVTVYFPEGEYEIAGETQTFDDPDDPDAENILEAQRKPQRSIEGYRVRFSKRDWVLEGYPADDGSTLFYATYLDDDEQHGGKSNATPPSTGSSGGGGSSSGSTTTSTGQEESVESAVQPEGAPADKPPMRTIKGNQVPKVADRIKDTYDVDKVGKLGVNLAVDQFENSRPGFILSDGTGIGKTRQALASLDYIQRAGDGEPVLYVTQSKPLVEKVKGEMATMNIVNPKVEFYTYDDIARGKLKDRRFGAVAFDEAHNLKNSTTKKAINSVPLVNESPFVMFITATPMDRVEAAAYFISKVTGEDRETILNRIGLTEVVKERRSGEQYTSIERLKGVTDGHISMELKALRDDLIARGAMVRREYPFYGTRDVIELEMSEQMQQEESDIIASWESEMEGGGNYRKVGQMLLELNRWIEAKKADEIYQRVKDDLAAGRQVVVFGETKSTQTVKGLGGIEQPGLLQALGDMLEQDGIEFSKIYSESGNNTGKQANLFQDGKTRVALATPQSGGTGIDLDDQVGSTPRSAYIATMNFSGDVFEQIMGRFTRRNTQSPTELHFVAFPDAHSENHRAEVLQRKLDVLSTIQGKEFQEDPVADLFAEEDIAGLGAPDIAPARITSDESTVATHNHVARPQGRIDSANGIDYEIQRIDEAINTPFKADILVNQISEAFGAGAESRVFIRRILEAIPGEKLQTLNVEFFEDESFGPGEYVASSATIRLNKAHSINDGDGIATVFTHEAGHFFAEEILGMTTIMDEWHKLGDKNRELAWKHYQKVKSKAATGSPDAKTLFNSKEAAHEWAAMQFHRIAVEGLGRRKQVTSAMKKEGMSQGFIDRIVAWVDQLREWFRSWLGDPSLSTDRLDKAFADALGANYVRQDGMKQDAAAQIDFLLQRAFDAGYDNVNQWQLENPGQFAEATKEWRNRGALDSPDTLGSNYNDAPENEALQKLERAGPSPANQALDEARREVRNNSEAASGPEARLNNELVALTRWAQPKGRVFDGNTFFRGWTRQVDRDRADGESELGGGGENLVYFDIKSDTWIKRNTLTAHENLTSFLRRIDAHNRIFPEAPLVFKGVLTDDFQKYDNYLDGEGVSLNADLPAHVVLAQRHVSSDRPLSGERIHREMIKRGFKGVVSRGIDIDRQVSLGMRYAEKGEVEQIEKYYHPEYEIYVDDLHEDNVFLEGDKVVFMDPGIEFPVDKEKPVEARERYGSPDVAPMMRNKDIRKRIDKARINNKRERTAAIAPEVTGRVEEGKRIVLENAWTTHDELNRIAFPLYNKLREQGRFDGTYEEFYREFTDTPITPKEAKDYLDNFDIEYDQLSRSDLDTDRRRNVDDYLLHEIFETVNKLDKRVSSNTGARDAAVKELDKLSDKLETYQKKFNDASALEAEALSELRKMLSNFKRSLGAKGGAAKLGRLGEVIRQLEGKEQLDNRIARKYLLGIERLIASDRFAVFDLLERASKLEINYKRPAHKIREQLKEEGVDSLEELSDSEFAAMLALAKADRHLIDTIVLRKIPEAKEKLAIVESEVAETRGEVDRARKATNNIKKYSALKGRIAGNRAAIMAKINRRKQQVRKFEEQISISRASRDHFNKALQKALGRVGATTRGEIVEGTGLFVPESEKSTRSDIEGSMTNFSYENTTQADMTRILAAQKRWLDGPQAEEMKRTDPLFYAQVLTQSIRITERTFKEVKNKSTSFTRGIYFDSLANSFDKTNTRAGKTLAQMLQRVESQSTAWRNEATTLGEKSDKARVRLGKALGFDNRPDLFSRQFTDVIDTPMKSYMEQPGATIRGFVRERLNNKVDARLVEAYYDAEVANAKFIGRVISHGMNQAGLGAVTNDRILVPDYANGGRLTPLEQLHRNVGTNTFLIRPRLDELSSIVHLADKGDFATPKEIRDLLKEMGENDMEPQAIDDAVNYLFRDNTAFDMLVGALARKDKVPVFVDGDGELVERSDAMSAWNEARTPAAFFRLLGGDMAENLGTVAELYNEVANAVKENENRKKNSREGVDQGDAPAIHARKADVWPSEWLAYRQGGATANHILVNEGILAAVFGKSRERIDAERQSLVQELRRKRNDAVLAKDQKTVAKYDDQISKIDGKNGLFDQLNEILGSQLGPLKDLRLGMELLGTGVGGVLNGPRAALVQLNQVYQTLLHFGISKTSLRMSATQIKTIMQDLLGSVFEAMGITLFRESEAFRLQKELFGLEPEKLNDFWDFTGDMGNEGNIGGAQRRVRQFNNLVFRRGLSRADAKDALYSSFKPWAPFSQLIGALHKAPMVAFRGEFDRFAANAIKAARGKDPTKVKFSAKEMGYSDLEFDRLNGILESRVGITLADVVARHEASNSKQAPFTNDEYRIISSVGLDLLASESNVFTTRSPQMHTAMGRWMFPLLGWAIQQPHNAAKMFKGGDNEVTRRTITSGILTAGFGLMPAVMAMAMFEDWFDEFIMGKKRNLRPVMTEDDSISSTAILERITRSGMLGMPMEIVNLGVNGVGGGDMRTASLDQRVFLANSIRSTVQLAGNIYAQKDITWNDGIRLGQLAGMNGALQQFDMFNNVLGLEGAGIEPLQVASRRTARINASNYLKVGGRMVGLELKSFSGSIRPTPVTPWVTRMQLAAMGGDAGDFQAAYKEALDAARDHLDMTGPREAEEYIARSWNSRHPLKGPFKTPPTPDQLNRLLGAIGERGATDVTEMISAYNTFGQRIGARAYHGKESNRGRSRNKGVATMANITGIGL